MTNLFITVDAEVCAYDPKVDTPETQIWGKTVDGAAYGIGFIMDELAARGWTCTFFLNVYDTNLWGEDPIAAIARTIIARGFDVQLHTHVEETGHLKGLSSFPLPDQCRILRQGADLLEKWTGVRPIWHRAGNLCANLDTLRACAAAGFVGDSSYLYGWPQCAELANRSQIGATFQKKARRTCSTALCAESEGRRSQIGATSNANARNLIRQLYGILELPITTFRTLPLLHNYRHLDLDACTYQELISIVRQAVRQGLPHVVLLMHSFSFVRRTDRGYVANMENALKFKRFLSAVEQINGIEVVDLKGTNTPHANPLPQGERAPDLSSGLLLTYHRAWEHRGRSWKHKLLVLIPVVLLVMLVVGVLCIRIHKM